MVNIGDLSEDLKIDSIRLRCNRARCKLWTQDCCGKKSELLKSCNDEHGINVSYHMATDFSLKLSQTINARTNCALYATDLVCIQVRTEILTRNTSTFSELYDINKFTEHWKKNVYYIRSGDNFAFTFPCWSMDKSQDLITWVFLTNENINVSS